MKVSIENPEKKQRYAEFVKLDFFDVIDGASMKLKNILYFESKKDRIGFGSLLNEGKNNWRINYAQ